MADLGVNVTGAVDSKKTQLLPLPDRPSRVSVEQARDWLGSPTPALVVTQAGTVLATNALATWIADKPAHDLLLNDIYEICANELLQPGAPVCCNGSFIDHKLTMYARIDPDVMRLGHLRLRQLDLSRQQCRIGHLCPPEMPVIPANQRGYRYPLVMNLPRTRDSGQSDRDRQEGTLLFCISDIRISMRRNDSPEKDLYLVIFDAIDETTVAAVADAFSGVGSEVFPSQKLIEKGLGLGADGLRQIAEEERPRITIQHRRTEFGLLLKKLRADAHLTAADLARQIGVSRTYVGHWESGLRPLTDPYFAGQMLEVLNPSASDRARFLSLLDVDLAQLETDDDHAAAVLLDRKLQDLIQLDAKIADLSSQRTIRIEEIRRLVRKHIVKDAELLQQTLEPVVVDEEHLQPRRKSG